MVHLGVYLGIWFKLNYSISDNANAVSRLNWIDILLCTNSAQFTVWNNVKMDSTLINKATFVGPVLIFDDTEISACFHGYGAT